MPSHSADLPSFHVAAVAVPATEDELPAAMPVLPGRSTAGNSDELTTMAVRGSPATDSDADEVTGEALGVSGAYIYGYDSAGNPTLTDAGNYWPSGRNLPG